MSEATKYESYETGANVDGSVRNNKWYAQTFTPSVSHLITKIYIYGRKAFSGCGDLIVSIRATSGGKPTGADLASCTILEADLPTSNTWIELELDSIVVAPAGTRMAMVARTNNAVGVNWYVGWRMDQTSPTYSGGQQWESSNQGSSWGGAGKDCLFQEWGVPTIETIPASNVQAFQETRIYTILRI